MMERLIAALEQKESLGRAEIEACLGPPRTAAPIKRKARTA